LVAGGKPGPRKRIAGKKGRKPDRGNSPATQKDAATRVKKQKCKKENGEVGKNFRSTRLKRGKKGVGNWPSGSAQNQYPGVGETGLEGK